MRPTREVDSAFLLKDGIGILCTRRNPLTRKRSLRWKDLAAQPLATLAQGTTLRAVLDKHADIGPVLPRPKYEASSISALVALVEHGAGIALLPSLAAFPALGRKLAFRTIHEPAMYRELFFVAPRRRTLTPAARQVAAAILAQLELVCRTPGLQLSMSASDLADVRRKVEGSGPGERRRA